MVDKRNVRRDAERKAREALGGDLVSTVGDLAMATADRGDAVESLTDALKRGDELITAAREHAEKLLAGARAELDSIDEQYAKSYASARAAGWTGTQLKGLGYERPAGRRSAGRGASERPDAEADRPLEGHAPAKPAKPSVVTSAAS